MGTGIRHIQVIDGVIKLFLKVCIIFKALMLVFRIWLRSVISKKFLLFEVTAYLGVKLINTCLDYIYQKFLGY